MLQIWGPQFKLESFYAHIWCMLADIMLRNVTREKIG